MKSAYTAIFRTVSQRHRRLPGLVMVVLCLSAALAVSARQSPSGMPSGPEEGAASPPDTAILRRPSAWTLTYPLGFHVPADVDTLPYNYQKRSIPNMATDAWATTGNIGGEGLNLIYMDRPKRGAFLFSRPLHHWTPDFHRQKFYNVYIPTTLLQYNYGGNRNNHQDRLQAEFAGNVNRRIGVGANVDYIYSKGSYESQAVKDFTFGFSAYYTGDRYEMQAFYNQYTFLNKENGGITDDLYITDPAVLQGGVSSIEPKSIPVRLTTAHNRLNGSEFYMNHAWKVGFWREEVVNDTLTRDVYVPVTKFIYSFDYRHYKHRFLNRNTAQAQEFWENTYFSEDHTDDVSTLNSFNNALGISLVEGFQKWAKFGLSAYASIENRRYRQPTFYKYAELPELPDDSDTEPGATPDEEGTPGSTLTPVPEGIVVDPTKDETIFRIGGRIEKTRGSILRYNADVVFGITGSEAGDLDLRGEITTMIPFGRDTLQISANGAFSNKAPTWFLQQYASNHFIWANDFGKERRYRAGGEIRLDRTRTAVRACVENMEHLVYFGPDSRPLQHSGNVQVISVALDQKLRFGILNWDNRVTWQKTTNSTVLPLPQLAVYSNLYLGFTAFKVLKLQIGADCDYYTRYTGLDYQPATMMFTTGSDIPVGNYAFCNVYATAKLYRTRFYVLWSHINQGWFSKSYFSLPHYPVNPRMFQIGLCIDFAD